MPVTVIVGVQWGDEGKGQGHRPAGREKPVWWSAFSGGPNAGHTVYNPHGKFTLHLVPAGIFYPHNHLHHRQRRGCLTICTDPKSWTSLPSKGIDTSRLLISARAHLIMPYHTLLDKLEEEAKGQGGAGPRRGAA